MLGVGTSLAEIGSRKPFLKNARGNVAGHKIKKLVALLLFLSALIERAAGQRGDLRCAGHSGPSQSARVEGHGVRGG
eukprot:8480135-Pyramimonas_sp.AAC.1